MRGRAALALSLALIGACTGNKPSSDAQPPASSQPAASSLGSSQSEAPVASSSAALSPATSAKAAPAFAIPDKWPGSSEGCPDGMVRVEGEYCPALVQECIEHHKEYKQSKGSKTVSERCLRYANPSRCVSKARQHMAFCVDRFEYPNKVGELPLVLTPWHDAVKLCEAQGKRLCTEDEFNFACEGPEMLPYPYGFERDANRCNIDREYRFPDHSRVLPTHDRCLETPWCKAELERLDQRHRIGERLTCVSWAGVYDITGNVNEWVNLPKEKPPNRSGLKGGWWGPVRSRCRPTVTFHKENDYGYEAGLRCCADAK